MGARVIVLGSINMDLVSLVARAPEGGQTVVGGDLVLTPGGKGANQAVAAAKLSGGRVAVKMIGRVGKDAFGGPLVRSLEGAGVDVSGVTVDAERPSGAAMIWVEQGGQNRIVVMPGANGAVGSEELRRLEGELSAGDVLLLQNEVPAGVNAAAIALAARVGAKAIYDPAPAAKWGGGVAPAVMTPNRHEAAVVTGVELGGADSVEQALEAMARAGVAVPLVKLDAEGCAWFEDGKVRRAGVYKAQVVDTVAAGDAFNGAMAVAMAEGRGLEECVERALAAGSLAVERRGAQEALPTLGELETRLARGK